MRTLLQRLILLLLACVAGAPLSPRATRAQKADAATTNRPRLVVQLGHSAFFLGNATAAFSSDGRFVVTGGDDGAILWEAATGRQIRRFWEKARVTAVIILRDGRSVLTAGAAGRERGLRLWDMASGREVWSQKAFATVAVLSPDGQWVLTCNESHATCMWEASTGRLVRCFEGHNAPVRSVAFSSDGRRVLTGSGEDPLYTNRKSDDSARLWDAATGRELKVFPHDGPVKGVAFSPDGRFILTASYDSRELRSRHRVRAWDVATLHEVRPFKYEPSDHFIAFSPDGRFFLTGSEERQQERTINIAILRDALTGEEVRRFAGVPSLIAAVAFSSDGRFILTVSSLVSLGEERRAARLWEVGTGKEVRRFEGYSASVQAVAISRDSRFVLTGGDDNQAHLWDLDAGQETQRFVGHAAPVTCVAFSPDGYFVLTGSFDHTARLWDASTGREVQRFKHGDTVYSAAFSPDRRRVLTGSADRTACLWDARSGQKIHAFEHAAGVDAGVFFPDGRHLMTSSTDREIYGLYRDNRVHLWDAVTFQQVWQRQSLAPVTSIEFSSDGRFALTRGDRGGKYSTLWDVTLGKEVTFFDSDTMKTSAVFAPDGRLIVIEYGDGRAVEPDLAKAGLTVRRFRYADFHPAAFSADGRLVVAEAHGLSDATPLFSAATGQELCRLISFRDGTWVVVDREGRFDTNNLEEIRGLHWVMPDEPMKPLPLEIFMRDYYEPRLLTRILDGERFKPVRSLSELNRVQPNVKITRVELQKGQLDRITVTVEVSKAKGEFEQGNQRITREAGVYDLRLFRDGQLVGQMPRTDTVIKTAAKTANVSSLEELLDWRQSAQVKLDDTGKQIIRFENIKLPRRADLRQVQFSAYAFNEDRVKSLTDKKAFDTPAGLAPVKGRAYLVTVGVNAYENPDWNLNFAVDDARLVQKILFENLSRTGQYTEIVQAPLISDYRPSDGRVIAKSATKGNFKAVLELLSGRKVEPEILKNIPNANKLQQARPEDFVLISFSSHGEYKDGHFYFLPYDIGAGRGRSVTNELLKRSISSEELSLWLRDVDAGEMVMIVDACHSAATVEAEGFKPGPMGSRGLGQLAYDKGMRILAASQADDVALESNELKHGLLVYALIRDGLEARQADYKPKDGQITLSEWLGYAVERVPKLNQEVDTGQVKRFGPTGDGRGTKVIVVRKRGSPKKVSMFQQPSLFDFARKKQEPILVK